MYIAFYDGVGGIDDNNGMEEQKDLLCFRNRVKSSGISARKYCRTPSGVKQSADSFRATRDILASL